MTAPRSHDAETQVECERGSGHKASSLLHRLCLAALKVGFTNDFADVALRMIGALRHYWARFATVAFLSVLVVLLDVMSAVVVGALLLAIEGTESIPLPILGHYANPLASLPERSAAIYSILLVIGLQLLREGAILGSELFVRRLGVDVGADLRSRISRFTLDTPFETVARHKRTDLVVYGTHFTTGVATFAVELSKLVSILVIITLYSAAAFIMEPVAFVSIFCVVIVLAVVTNRLVLRLEGLSLAVRDSDIRYYNRLQDGVLGLRDIVISGRRGAFLHLIQNAISALKNVQWKSMVIQSIVTPLQRSIALLLFGGFLVALVAFAGESGPIVSYERLLFIVFILLRLYGPVAQLNLARATLLTRAGPVAGILVFLEQLGKTTLGAGFKRPASGTVAQVGEPREAGPSGSGMAVGDITFDRVSFKYRGANTRTLSDISFCAPQGSTTAIVGPTGSGKSTIIDILARLWRPTSGEIRIGSTNLEAIDEGVWRKSLAVIHQNGFIFNGTIAENISMFRQDFSREEIEAAADQASLTAFVQSTPNGFDTLLGGPENPLSGGQKQRLQIARAFLAKPQLLILDEATSAQDALSEDALLRAIKRDFAASTIIVIAHRFSAIREADHIVVIDDGRLIDAGDWRTLMQRPGLFRQFVDAQTLEKAGLPNPTKEAQ